MKYFLLVIAVLFILSMGSFAYSGYLITSDSADISLEVKFVSSVIDGDTELKQGC